MSDKFKGIYVTFEKDLTGEQAEQLMVAMKQIRGVEAVTMDQVDWQDYNARMNVRFELSDEIFKFWNKVLGKGNEGIPKPIAERIIKMEEQLDELNDKVNSQRVRSPIGRRHE